MTTETPTEPEKKSGSRLLGLMQEWVNKIMPAILLGVIGANINLYIDNINNKKDIAREMWRNDQQDIRADRAEIRNDRQDESLSELHDTQKEFQGEALHRLDILLEKQERNRRRREK